VKGSNEPWVDALVVDKFLDLVCIEALDTTRGVERLLGKKSKERDWGRKMSFLG
jgi:hypothetical protein